MLRYDDGGSNDGGGNGIGDGVCDVSGNGIDCIGGGCGGRSSYGSSGDDGSNSVDFDGLFIHSLYFITRITDFQ